MPHIDPAEQVGEYLFPPRWSGLECPSCACPSPAARESFSTPGLWYADCMDCGMFWKPEQPTKE